ncbi:MAG: hypothetical protein JWO19_5880 [Bryobacterales bacterium]|nr:hypothetical protein [Bryobacterales bacterium]
MPQLVRKRICFFRADAWGSYVSGLPLLVTAAAGPIRAPRSCRPKRHSCQSPRRNRSSPSTEENCRSDQVTQPLAKPAFRCIIYNMRVRTKESFLKTRMMTLLMCAFFFSFGKSAQAAESWDMAIAYPPGNYQAKSAEQFAAEVAKATNGEVSVKVQAGGALGFKGPEMLAAIGDGLVPIGTMLLNQQVGVEPLLGIASLPYLVSTSTEMRIITELARPTYEKIAAKHNQKILYIIPWPGQNIFAKPEIRQPGDFRLLKIRTVDRNGSDFFRELGASPAQMPWGEVVPSLATGVINSVTTSSSSGVDGQFWDFITHCYLVNWQSNFDMVTVNLDQWRKLTPTQQKSIEDVARKLEPEFWKAAEEEDASKLKLLSDKGIKLIEADAKIRDLMIEKAKPAWEEFMTKVPPAREIIEKYRAATKK